MWTNSSTRWKANTLLKWALNASNSNRVTACLAHVKFLTPGHLLVALQSNRPFLTSQSRMIDVYIARVNTALNDWRPRRDSNPCYRRESGKPNRKLQGTQEHGRTGCRSKNSKFAERVGPTPHPSSRPFGCLQRLLVTAPRIHVEVASHDFVDRVERGPRRPLHRADGRTIPAETR